MEPYTDVEQSKHKTVLKDYYNIIFTKKKLYKRNQIIIIVSFNNTHHNLKKTLQFYLCTNCH